MAHACKCVGKCRFWKDFTEMILVGMILKAVITSTVNQGDNLLMFWWRQVTLGMGKIMLIDWAKICTSFRCFTETEIRVLGE